MPTSINVVLTVSCTCTRISMLHCVLCTCTLQAIHVNLSTLFTHALYDCVLTDASYQDPLGPQMERPKTAARRRDEVLDEFGDEELGEDLLPE